VAIGVGVITFYTILLIAGGEELIIEWSRWPVAKIRLLLRCAVLATPFVTAAIAYIVARTLKRSGKEGLLYLSWRDFRPGRSDEERAEPAVGESYPGPTSAHPTVPGSAVPGESIRREPVPGPGLVLHSEGEQERGEAGAEERPLTEVPTWLKRKAEEQR
jgi:hypothetical protein